MKLIVATNNAHKLVEFKRILEPLGFEVFGQKEMGVNIEPEETGTTFAENARIKALAIHKATGTAVVSDDSGLCVDALGGEPGVYSARYGGADAVTDIDRYNLLLKNLADTPKEKRTARFVSAICCVLGESDIVEAEGTCEGYIGTAPRGENGFGYDPIFMVGDSSMSELSAEQKDSISHRGNALQKLQEKLANR